MKKSTIIQLTILILLASGCLMAYSPSNSPLKMNGEKEMNFSIVNELALEGNFNITLEQGTTGSVDFIKKQEKNIEMEQVGTKLTIKQKQMLKKQEIKITLPELSKIESKGILKLNSKKAFKGSHLELALSGVVGVVMKDIEYQSIVGSSNGISILDMSGKADSVNVVFNGFGVLENDKLSSKHVLAKNSSIGLMPYLSELINKSDKVGE